MEVDRQAVARGDEGTRFVNLWSLSEIEWLAGSLRHARDYAAAAQEIGEQTFPATLPWVGRIRALVETDLGLVEEARANAEAGLAAARAFSHEIFVILILGVLGRLELALGDLEAAVGHLRELPGRLLAGGWNDPAQPPRGAPDPQPSGLAGVTCGSASPSKT